MRPVKLTMQAFGSYGKLTQIDFRELNQNLFLITGDTGAGKTTIFDAIVFALYGEASSGTNKKEGIVLQSQYVGLNVEPFVELVFSEGTGENSQIYTVRRVPRHLKLLTRGAGKNTGSREVTGSVSLIMPDGTEYPQKEADSKLGEILGLTKSQFMQVAMIAQGEFMELLRAKSDDKKVIFRKLFNTKLYQDIVDELMSRKRSLEKDIDEIRAACQTETAHVIIPLEYEKYEEMDVQKKQIQSGKIIVMDQFLENLAELCGELKDSMNSAKKELEAVSKIRDEKRDIYNTANQLKALYSQLEKAVKQLEECRATEAQIREKITLSDQIKKAYEIKGEYVRYQDSENNLQNREKALKEQQERRPQLENVSRIATEEGKQTKAALDRELAVYTSVSERVKKELKLLEQIKKTEVTVKNSREAFEAAQTADQKARAAIEELEKRETEWRLQSEKLGDINEKIAVWNGKKQELASLDADACETGRLLENAETQRKQAEKAKASYIQIRQSYERKNQEYETMRRAFLDEQAGFLARELQPGKPCPVCGALEHPNPCIPSSVHGNLTREILDQTEKEAAELRGRQELMAGEAKSNVDLTVEKERILLERLSKLSGRIMEKEPEFSGKEVITILKEPLDSYDKEKIFAVLEEIKDLLDKWKAKLQEEGERLRVQKKELRTLQENLSLMDQRKKAAKNAADKSAQSLTDAAAADRSAVALLEQLMSSREYPSKEAAVQENDQAKKKKELAEAAFQTAQTKEKEASGHLVKCVGLIQQYEHELPELQKICQERMNQYHTLINEKDMTESEWTAIADNHLQEEAERLQKEADTWRQKKIAAQTAEKTARDAIGERTQPDLSLAKAQMEAAEQNRVLVQDQFDLYKEQYKANKDACDALTPQMEKRGKIIEQHTKLETLYKLLSGNMSGNRMDLETYVQRYYLEKILYAANRRFADMSAGQFELRMVDDENAGKGKNRGLDLMVYSNVTGKEREVRTLSGGESFMAALSLALGMADQIQESSAAINLDVMFVDEGFGSLDEHSREQAVKVLQELAGGSKLIGIISHVTELKQEIEDQLLVGKDEKGSHVKWQI